MEIIILGSGPSSSVPSIHCILHQNIEKNKKCKICLEAYTNPLSKNKRGNPSIYIRLKKYKNNLPISVLIDCGKTFRDAVLNIFPKENIYFIDSLILTHGHADACLGMDDLRELQPYTVKEKDINGKDYESTVKEQVKIPNKQIKLYSSKETYKEISERFRYLMPSSDLIELEKTNLVLIENNNTIINNNKNSIQDNNIDERKINMENQDKNQDEIQYTNSQESRQNNIYRWTAQLNCQIFQSFEKINISNKLSLIPLPVYHGGNYISYGFEFGIELNYRIVYISDISKFHDETLKYLKIGKKIDYLIIDALYKSKNHGTHFNKNEAIHAIKALKPVKSYLIGMCHDFDYYQDNEELKLLKYSQDIDVEMAYDGMKISLN